MNPQQLENIPLSQDGRVTLVLTSYKRPDLLNQTLTGLVKYCGTEIDRFIVIEDSDCNETGALVEKHFQGREFLYLQNTINLGQIASVDRAYAHVDSQYIFHCEEDWRFTRSSQIGISKTILERDPEILAVMMRAPKEHPAVFLKAGLIGDEAAKYYKVPRFGHHLWGNFSFNPGLRRRSDFLECGPYAKIGHETELSWYYKTRGLGLAILEHGGVHHIGEQASTHNRNVPWRRLKKLSTSAFKRLRFWKLRLTTLFE